MTRKFVKPGGPVTGPGGMATPGFNDYLDGIVEALSRIDTSNTSITALQAAVTALEGLKYNWPVFIEAPVNGDYRLIPDVSFAGTITKVTTRSVSGTCTATVKINSTALGGGANSVSSAGQAKAHTSANEFVAPDDIVLTISANAACENMSLNIEYTRS